MQKLFLDSDVILDVLLQREPFFVYSKNILLMSEIGKIQGVTSSTCIANIYYLLRKNLGDKSARIMLSLLLKNISVLPVYHNTILTALISDFSDFEDAIQHACAVENGCSAIITRNLQDYKTAKITVFTPEQFLTT